MAQSLAVDFAMNVFLCLNAFIEMNSIVSKNQNCMHKIESNNLLGIT